MRVENATVTFDVNVYNGIESSVNKGQVTSDTKGFFRISGYHGESLGFMPHKEGYIIATYGYLFKIFSHGARVVCYLTQGNPK